MRFEHWRFTWPLRLRSLLRGRHVDQEMNDELQFHLEQKIAEAVEKGASLEEARFVALRAMGGLDQRREEMRDLRGVQWLTDLLDDVRYAIRSLRRTPGLTSLVIMTLALGIGMTTTPLSMVDALIFRPYPVPQPNAIVTLVSTTRDTSYDNFSYREYLDIRRRTTSYDGVIANAATGIVGFSAEAGATPRIAGGMMVSGNYFRVLGVEPRLGRSFREDEDGTPGRHAVVVLSAAFWHREFASDPGVLGRTIRVNGVDFTVIGVAPDSFPGLAVFGGPDFYVSLAMARVLATSAQKDFFEDRDDRELSVKARLATGITLRQARNELAIIAGEFARDYPAQSRDRGAAVRTQFEMHTRNDDVNWKFSVIFTILALAVLLVACTNVAGLLLSRARSRTREVAVRLALGAGRVRLVRLLLTEVLILALLGGLGGIAVGYSGISLLRHFTIPAELPLTIPFRMDARLLVASFVLSIVVAILCGLMPALQGTRTDLINGLKTADVDAPGRRRWWGRDALVVAQVSMSLMLLTAAFLMARSFERSAETASGFAKDHLLMVRFDPRLVQYDSAETQRFYQLLTEGVRSAPRVLNAGLTQNPPLGLGEFERVAFVPDGVQMPRDREHFTSLLDTVDEGFFETMGIPIVRGRGFRASDTDGKPRVAVVNEYFARHYWPQGDALGQHFRLGSANGEPVEIVGVVPTLKYGSGASGSPIDFVYLPLGQHPVTRMVLMVRSVGDPLRLVGTVKDVVRTLNPNLPLSETRSYEDVYRYSTVEGPRVAIQLVGTMGVVGLLLAAAGLYGLVAYTVGRRTREIGIRMALGATSMQVLRLVTGKSLTLVAIGTTVGLAMGVGIERLMNSMVFNTGGIDLLAYLIVVPSTVLVTLLAAWVPARQAILTSPTQALRCE